MSTKSIAPTQQADKPAITPALVLEVVEALRRLATGTKIAGTNLDWKALTELARSKGMDVAAGLHARDLVLSGAVSASAVLQLVIDLHEHRLG